MPADRAEVGEYSMKVMKVRRTERIPEYKCKVVVLLSLFAQFEQSAFPRIGIHKVDNQRVYLRVFLDSHGWRKIVVSHELADRLVRDGVCEGGGRKGWGFRVKTSRIGIVMLIYVVLHRR